MKRKLLVLLMIAVITLGFNKVSAEGIADEELFVAVKNNNLPLAESLIASGANINVRFPRGGTSWVPVYKNVKLLGFALGEAAANGNLDMVKMLINNGADINLYIPNGLLREQPAIGFAMENNQADVVNLLIERGADVRIACYFYQSSRVSLINWAAQRNDIQLMNKVMNKGFFLADEKSLDALSVAAASGDLKLVKTMLVRGWNREGPLADHGGFEAVSRIQLDAIKSALINKHLDVAQVLLREAKWINLPSSHLRHYSKHQAERHADIFIAATNAQLPEFAAEMLKRGLIDPNLIFTELDTYKKQNATLLNEVASIGNAKIVKMLIDTGAKVNMSNGQMWTPLMKAAEKGHSEVVKVLLVAGAKPNMINTEGRTAAGIAQQNGYQEIAQMILAINSSKNGQTEAVE